jgi:hypothetical protein
MMMHQRDLQKPLAARFAARDLIVAKPVDFGDSAHSMLYSVHIPLLMFSNTWLFTGLPGQLTKRRPFVLRRKPC